MATGTYSPQTQLLIEIISSRPIAYHPRLAKIFGGVTNAVLLSQLLYWHGKQADPDGWIQKTVAEIWDETGLTERQQETSRAFLLSTGAISYIRKGLPAKPFYRINHVRMVEYALEKDKLQLGQNVLSSEDIPSEDLLAQNALSNDIQITTESTTTGAGAPGASSDYLQDLFNRKKAKARESSLIAAINQRVKNPAHRDACLEFAKLFPDCIFDYGEWIGTKGANIEKYIRFGVKDKTTVNRAIELHNKAVRENPMFAARSPVMFTKYLSAACAATGVTAQGELITVGDGLVIQSL